MTTEVLVLILAALWTVVQFVLYAAPANRELGPGYTMSARDRDPSRAMSERTARLGRAFDNQKEWLLLFTVAVVTVQMSGQNSWFTGACAWLYLLARMAYVPAYALGLKPWRSAIWSVGLLATVLMLLAALI